MHVFECPFSFHARKNPNHIALLSKEEKWTYKQCHQIVESIAQSLKHIGVQSGDRIGLYPSKSFPTPLIFFALFRLGAIACPVNTYLPPSTVPQKLDEMGATMILYPDSISLPSMKQIALPFSNLKFNQPPSSDQFFLEKEAHGTYLFTSGTTSNPKIACLSLGNHYYSALGSNAYLSLDVGDRWLLSLPLYHVSGIAILFRSFLAGATVILSEEKPTSEELFSLKATHLSFVPAQLHRLLEANPEELMQISKQVKCLLLGGAFIPQHLYQKGIERGIKLHPTYGMTEMSSQIATQLDPRSPLISLGHPLPYRELKIAEDGEVLVRGKTLFKGYLTAHDTPELNTNSDGWLCTHDLGSYSAKKGLRILGRKDRLFISGGENIHPEEIERILENVQGIIDARVDPIADKEFGFRPVAYIKSSEAINEKELRDYLSSFLPKFKVPVAFFSMEEGNKRTFKASI